MPRTRTTQPIRSDTVDMVNSYLIAFASGKRNRQCWAQRVCTVQQVW